MTAMPAQLLETKLFAPRPRGSVVPRPRLAALVDRGGRSKLTLVSAPPGFGKSTLLADWAAAEAAPTRSVAWVSLDSADSDPSLFWRYVVASLQRVAPHVAEAITVDDVKGGGAAMLTRLLNAMAESDGDLVLILDDYHAIEHPEIHGDVAFLVEHLPPQAHLVIASRADPPLPLARLRARGELVEVRASDLRFTSEEAATYLSVSMGLALTPGDIDALERRTEGWIAALQLAALSMEGRTDTADFIAGFAGDHRYIVDYLAQEVLDRQPDTVRQFLLETSILDRLSGPLCDAVTGRTGSSTALEALARANLFVVPLDDHRAWYRYHHLFSQVLQAKLTDDQPQLEPELHRRASTWFHEHADEPGAVRHALAAGDADRAADLIELAAHDLRANRQEVTLRGWLDALPDTVFKQRPVLAIAHVGALLSTGEVKGVERRLADAARWVDASRDEASRSAATAAGMVVRHAHALAHLPAAIALHRAGLSRLNGDVAATIEHARTALVAAGEDQPLERGAAAGLLALAHWSRGDLEPAEAGWSEAVENLERAGHLADVLGCSIGLADVQAERGRLNDARRTFERGLSLGTAGSSPLPGTADMHVGLAEVLHRRNDLAAARDHLERARQLGEALGLPQHPYRLRVAMALVQEAEGRPDQAVALLDEAQERYVADFFPEVRPIPALRARVLIAQGRLQDAGDWARQADLSTSDEPDYLRCFEQATLARVLLARGLADDALRLGERLLAAAEAARRTASALDILVVVALARRARGDSVGAAAALGRAVAIAEPQGLRRPFLGEGRPMLVLLREVSRTAQPPAFIGHLLAAAGPGGHAVSVVGQLVDPLSVRELEVLRLLQGDLDGPDMAQELFISLNTLRTHTKNIYAKLGANSRRAAITRAVELGLLQDHSARR
jgi:ATP/maltotriose-dependent transcriptional regulator MalT